MEKAWKNFSILLGTIAFSLVLGLQPFPATSGSKKWTNICPNTGVIYCDNIGKNAFNRRGGPREIILGKIIGVAWKLKGSVIGTSPAIPSAGIPEEIRLSPRDAYFFIIDDGTGPAPFLRQCRDIQAN